MPNTAVKAKKKKNQFMQTWEMLFNVQNRTQQSSVEYHKNRPEQSYCGAPQIRPEKSAVEQSEQSAAESGHANLLKSTTNWA